MSALFIPYHHSCFPGVSDSKESACNAGDPGSIAGLGRSPGGGHGNPLQYSCQRIPWTEETGGLQSMGLQRVRHNRVTKIHTRTQSPLSFGKSTKSVSVIDTQASDVLVISPPSHLGVLVLVFFSPCVRMNACICRLTIFNLFSVVAWEILFLFLMFLELPYLKKKTHLTPVFLSTASVMNPLWAV